MTGLVMTSSGSGYTVVVWVYGASLGGYHYTLRMSIYHVVRARSVPSTYLELAMKVREDLVPREGANCLSVHKHFHN